MWRLRIKFLVIAGAVILSEAQLPTTGAQTNQPNLGAQRFVEFCAGCHGADARGGDKAPSLVSPSPAAVDSDADLTRIVREGNRGGMPPFAQIGETNIEAIVSYLRDLQGEKPSGTASEIVLPGDADTGHALFFGKAQCSSCHMVHGEGGFIAANLSAYGRNLTPDAIWRAITNPDNPLVRSSRVATVTTSNGQKLTGVLRNEDSFTVELQTESGRYYMFARKDLSNIQYTDHSLMPRDYGERLRPKELDDIVSYLVVAARPQEKTEGRDH